MIDVAPGTVVVFSDIGCPWSHCAVHRLWRARRQLGLEDDVRFDHRAFPLELHNRRPTPKLVLDAEIAAIGPVEGEAGWQLWTGPVHEWPVTTLLALEAVQAAKDQGLAASEQLDLALRRALFAESRCISLRHVVLEAAGSCSEVDEPALAEALDDGRARRAVIEQWRASRSDAIKGSPHLFLPGGDSVHNPGIEMHWERSGDATDGEEGGGYPVIDSDDPSVYEDILRRAAS